MEYFRKTLASLVEFFGAVVVLALLATLSLIVPVLIGIEIIKHVNK